MDIVNEIVRGLVLDHAGVADQGSYGVAPYIVYNGSTNYSTRPSGALRGLTGLTAGGWFQTTSSDFLMGVWVEATDHCWKLSTSGSNQAVFSVSSSGANTFVVTGGIIPASTWTHIVGRYIPSTEIAVFVNGVKTVNITSIPSALAATTVGFFVGGNGSEFLTGKASMLFVSAEPLVDNYITVLYNMSRNLYA